MRILAVERYFFRQLRAANEKIYDLEGEVRDMKLLLMETLPNKRRKREKA